MFEPDVEKKSVLDVRTWRESVQDQRNMSKGIGRDRKYQCTKWAVTDLLLLGNSVYKSG